MRRTLRFLTLFVLLGVFWQILSARIDPLFIVLGVLSCAVSAWFGVILLEGVISAPRNSTSDRAEQITTDPHPTDRARVAVSPRPRIDPVQLIGYSLWLVTRIPPAGLTIARIVLDPRLTPRPGVVRFRTGLESPVARSLLANSITLVPGTMTLNVIDDEFVVHAFTPDAVIDLANAATQRRIARIFRVAGDDPPTMRWDEIHDAMPEEPQ